MVLDRIREFLFPGRHARLERMALVRQSLDEIQQSTTELRTKARQIATHPDPIRLLAKRMRYVNRKGNNGA